MLNGMLTVPVMLQCRLRSEQPHPPRAQEAYKTLRLVVTTTGCSRKLASSASDCRRYAKPAGESTQTERRLTPSAQVESWSLLYRMKRTMRLRDGDGGAKTSKWGRCAGGGPMPRV